MKGRVLIAGGLSGYWCGSVAADQSPEIFHGPGSQITKEAKDDSSLSRASFNIKIDAMRYFRQSSVTENGNTGNTDVRWIDRSMR
jgi:hypothetical protein